VVKANETLLRSIVLLEELATDENGDLCLTSASFRLDDLAQKPIDKKNPGKLRSVSVLRKELTAVSIVEQRVNALKRYEDADPFVGLASTSEVRSIVDEEQRREVCVNTDPTHSDDRLGACSTHASIVRSQAQQDQSKRLSWHKLRSELASKFDRVVRISGL
jgi:hypothetical protein